MDTALLAAWRRNHDLELECAKWRECAEIAQLDLHHLGKSEAKRSIFSWLIHEIRRTGARFQNSVRKRMLKLRNFFRRLAGKKIEAPRLQSAPRPKTATASRRKMLHAAELSPEDLLLGPAFATPSQAGGEVCDVAVYYNTAGNYFFQEIALLIHAALAQAGLRAQLRTDEHGAAADARLHLVIAPHEFFPLGNGASCFGKNARDRLLLLNTEQSQTQWYRLAKMMFPHARHVFDMDRETAAAIQSSGFAASHLPLGFVENFAPYSAERDLQPGPETEALGMDVRAWRDTGRPLAERPIALSFVGEATPRRSAFFMKAAPLLEKHECHLRLMPRGSGPWTAGRSHIHSRTLTTAGISQRSRIVFNVHRDEEHYFEWHRIVLMGIWQRALVITETASETEPFVPGEDYVQAPLEKLPGLIEYYLCDPQGIEEAERIRNSGYERLKTQCRLPEMLEKIIMPLLAETR